MLDTISNWVLQNILGGIVEACQQMLTLFGSLIEGIFSGVAEFNTKFMGDVTDFTLVFAIAFIILMAAKAYFSTYVLETEGDPESDPIDIMVRASQAIAIASCSNVIYDFFFEFSRAFVEDMQSVHIGGNNTSVGIADNLTTLLSIPSNLQNGAIVIVIMVLGMLIALLVFCISAGIRGAELVLMKMLFPIFACDLLTTNRERWNAFFTSFVITWVAYGLQLISFKMFGVALTSFIVCGVDEFLIAFASCIGWLIVMLRAPKWLEKYCYASGISNTVSGTMRSLPFMLRKG